MNQARHAVAIWQVRVDEYDSGHVCARAVADEDTGWFEGHFPGQPILPGVGLLALVEQTLHAWATLRSGEPITVRGLERVRFRAPVLPGAELFVEVRAPREQDPVAPVCYDFVVKTEEHAVCTGRLLA